MESSSESDEDENESQHVVRARYVQRVRKSPIMLKRVSSALSIESAPGSSSEDDLDPPAFVSPLSTKPVIKRDNGSAPSKLAALRKSNQSAALKSCTGSISQKRVAPNDPHALEYLSKRPRPNGLFPIAVQRGRPDAPMQHQASPRPIRKEETKTSPDPKESNGGVNGHTITGQIATKSHLSSPPVAGENASSKSGLCGKGAVPVQPSGTCVGSCTPVPNTADAHDTKQIKNKQLAPRDNANPSASLCDPKSAAMRQPTEGTLLHAQKTSHGLSTDARVPLGDVIRPMSEKAQCKPNGSPQQEVRATSEACERPAEVQKTMNGISGSTQHRQSSSIRNAVARALPAASVPIDAFGADSNSQNGGQQQSASNGSSGTGMKTSSARIGGISFDKASMGSNDQPDAPRTPKRLMNLSSVDRSDSAAYERYLFFSHRVRRFDFDSDTFLSAFSPFAAATVQMESVKSSDVCAVCGAGGTLITCGRCPLGFHLRCVHPPLKAAPPSE